MVKLSGTFGKFRPFKALVLGDFMLDTYTTGKIKRISPEAPVPVMEVLRQESRPGGAGNVVLNLYALGAKVYAVGRLGDDAEGESLKGLLSFEGIDLSTLVTEKGYYTPVKNRLVADHQQILRVDREKVVFLSKELEEKIIENLETLIPKMEIVAISDYGKGFLTENLIQAAIQIANRHGILTIVDPKGIDFTKYRGASILKPNLSEAMAAAKKEMHTSLTDVAREIFSQVQVKLLLVTRSEAGMSLFYPDGREENYPVRSKEVIDVTGAGDTVLATLCLVLASKLDVGKAVEFANIAAGIAIERLGCIQVTLEDLAERLLEIDSDTKVFDESHIFALHKMLKGKNFSLLVLQKQTSLTSLLFQEIKKLSSRKNHELIIYVQGARPKDEFIHLLSSLQEVDYIILQKKSLQNLVSKIRPNEIYEFYEEKHLVQRLLNPPSQLFLRKPRPA